MHPRLPLLINSALAVLCFLSPVQSADAIKHPQVGVCTHMRIWPEDKVLGLLKESGATWVRDDFDWPKIEKVKGDYRMPEDYPRWIDKSNEAGLKNQRGFQYRAQSIFYYGEREKAYNRLENMVSYYDYSTGEVPRPKGPSTISRSSCRAATKNQPR